MPSGSLTVVGTGIRLGQISLEARACIECAGKVFFLVTDPLTASWIIELNPSAESLVGYYRPGKDRSISYREMVERMLTCVREGLEVCVAIYGHPGVFADPPHEAIRRARLEGYEARMLPAISAEDCLFADLGINPGRTGCQSFEATDFLVRRHRFDTRSALILWQIGATCDLRFRTTRNLSGIRILTNYLQKYYGRAHKVVPMKRPNYLSAIQSYSMCH